MTQVMQHLESTQEVVCMNLRPRPVIRTRTRSHLGDEQAGEEQCEQVKRGVKKHSSAAVRMKQSTTAYSSFPLVTLFVQPKLRLECFKNLERCTLSFISSLKELQFCGIHTLGISFPSQKLDRFRILKAHRGWVLIRDVIH